MRVVIPRDTDEAELTFGKKRIRLTHLRKRFWKKRRLTKRDLLQYYADVSAYLLPHLKDRAMVMKRYPNGAEGEFLFMKRAPKPHPDWLEICEISFNKGPIDFPVVSDVASLLWIVNLGCIDLNQWYGSCRNANRPDYLHFDLDPTEGTSFEKVRETSLVVRDALKRLGIPCHAKTTGATGIHVYVPIKQGPLQKEVWTFAKALALELEARHPKLVTAQFLIAKRPKGTVLVDYNQNAWGRTLASVYSVRPTPDATVSMPVTWREIEHGVEPTEFRIDNVLPRLKRRGDLWKPLLAKRGRFDLGKFI